MLLDDEWSWVGTNEIRENNARVSHPNAKVFST